MLTASTTDYAAPRRSTIEDAETESLARSRRHARMRSPQDVDLDESDAGEAHRTDPCGPFRGKLTMVVHPKQADEFTCTSCFLEQHRSRLASRPGEPPVCAHCA